MYFKKFIKSLIRHKVYISFHPTAYIPGFTINFSFLSFVLIIVVFFLFISFSLFNHFETVDYYALKVENIILKNKIRNIIINAKEGLDYLEFVKRTENQISKLIGKRKFLDDIYYNKSAVGGPSYIEEKKLKNILENLDYSKIDDTQISESYNTIKTESQKILSSYEDIINYITNKINHLKSLPAGWPVIGNITSGYGYRLHPFTLSYDFHSGVDIANEPGTPVKSTADGVVRYTGWAMGYGLCVIIDHGFGYSTLYGHLSQSTAKQGDIVKRGQIIGLLGSTGTSTGPHLHYEVWEYGITKNPMSFISISTKNIKGDI